MERGAYAVSAANNFRIEQFPVRKGDFLILSGVLLDLQSQCVIGNVHSSS
jgi:hypothetical protein